MGAVQNPLPTALFIAVMYHQHCPIDTVMTRLAQRFGECDALYGPVPFTWTDYYAKEMGEELLKTYLCYHIPFPREELPSVKIWTNAVEQELAKDGRRIVNIDPGYLARDKLVLASTKDFYHRLYLGQGIYGEVTLHFRQGRYRYFSWTYPDFKEEGLQDFLMKERVNLAGDLKKLT